MGSVAALRQVVKVPEPPPAPEPEDTKRAKLSQGSPHHSQQIDAAWFVVTYDQSVLPTVEPGRCWQQHER